MVFLELLCNHGAPSPQCEVCSRLSMMLLSDMDVLAFSFREFSGVMLVTISFFPVSSFSSSSVLPIS